MVIDEDGKLYKLNGPKVRPFVAVGSAKAAEREAVSAAPQHQLVGTWAVTSSMANCCCTTGGQPSTRILSSGLSHARHARSTAAMQQPIKTIQELDKIGMEPNSKKGHICALVIQDYFTKLPKANPLKGGSGGQAGWGGESRGFPMEFQSQIPRNPAEDEFCSILNKYNFTFLFPSLWVVLSRFHLLY